MESISAGDFREATILATKGIGIEARDSQGQTPLHMVAMLHDETQGNELAKVLITNGADVNARSSSGATPLHYAALNGDTDLARMLVSAGAHVSWTNSSGATPLFWALTCIDNGKYVPRKEVADFLIESGASLSPIERFNCAVMESDIQKLQDMIEQDPSLLGNTTPLPSLHYAVLSRKPDAARFLLKKGTDVDIRGGVWMTTPLHFASLYGYPEMVQLFLEYGADVAVTNTLGGTAISMAKTDEIRQMLQHWAEQSVPKE